MTKRYFEDFHVGDRFDSATHAVTEAQITAFARDFDPQPFHLDPGQAAGTLFGGLVASGWHTASVTMRLLVDSGLNVEGGFIGLGVEELRWPKAVRPGDILRVSSEILDLRISQSRPDRGIVRLASVTTNQDDEVVQTMRSAVLVRRRPSRDRA